MTIKDITIENFKSIYGKFKIDFTQMTGLVKLSGPIGSGKTTIAEAILYGLFGNVKGQNNNELIAWNMKDCCVEMNLTSKGKDIYIKRSIYEPLLVEVNGKPLAASNKKNTQLILEEDLYDIPKLAVVKMCVISFNAFNSLASMNTAETKQFSDEIFGFKLFTDCNEEVKIEKTNQTSEFTKLSAIYNDTQAQIDKLKEKKEQQETEVKMSLDIDEQNKLRADLIEKGKNNSLEISRLQGECRQKVNEVNVEIDEIKTKMTEAATLGKQEKNWYNTFKSGICPTCGQPIDESHIETHHKAMLEYAETYKKLEAEKNELVNKANEISNSYVQPINDLNNKIQDIKKEIAQIDSKVKVYENNIKVINSNYGELIAEYEIKLSETKAKLDNIENEITDWNEMGELFTKTLRYGLLDTLIPHINKSIQYFIDKLDQSYKVEYDQEFKAHVYVDAFEKEISYRSLSTGQRKTLDLAIIFGILQNIIASVDFNVFVLDELFSNMDADTRNTMLSLLKETMTGDKCIFVINHAEMNDDYFAHKVRVSLENKKAYNKKTKQTMPVKASKYEQIF